MDDTIHHAFHSEPDQLNGARHDRSGTLTPYQLRDVTLISIGATFRPSVVLARLPTNLRATEGFTGGFFVTLAREGHVLAPFSSGHVWFDVQGHDGSAGPCRLLLRHRTSPAEPTGHVANRAGSAHSDITDSRDHVVGSLHDRQGPLFRLTVQPRRNWTAGAGIDHSINCCDVLQPAARMTVIPWAADWSDAEPVSVEILAPHWADLTPQKLTWAAYGKQGAMTLGLSIPLPA